ncbi:MAG: YceI family protein [Gammaproteobacteria bacterium]|nr:YceI family protein [Gammaproteobacteria bacterium]
MNLRMSLLASLAIVAAPLGAAERYEFDEGHTSILYFIGHLGLSEMQGEFHAFEGDLLVDTDHLARSSVAVRIDAGSADMDHDKLDEMLRDADFFNVAKFPTLDFRSTRIEVRGENVLAVTGDLTLLGVTRPVTLDVQFRRVAVHPLAKRPAIGVHATTTIRRSDFGMKHLLGMVADEVTIRIDTEAIAAATVPVTP